MRMLRLSDAFRTNGDFLERVELSLSLRLIYEDTTERECEIYPTQSSLSLSVCDEPISLCVLYFNFIFLS